MAEIPAGMPDENCPSRLRCSKHAALETGSSPAFDLAAPMLLEYLLERFFEAGEGAKAV
jgi:hypothetical protein